MSEIPAEIRTLDDFVATLRVGAELAHTPRHPTAPDHDGPAGRGDPALPYALLLGALAIWGCGLGVLPSALVSGAVAAVPGRRSGLASAVNNTARQSGGALGIAACAALAGPVADPGFLGGFRLAEIGRAHV